MLSVGIDTGINGGYAILKNREVVEVGKIKTINLKKKVIDTSFLKELLSGKDHIFIEKAIAMPKQGIVSTGRFFEVFGIVQGICVGLGIPYTIINSVQWKKKMLQGFPKDKHSSIVRVKQLYPNVELKTNDHHIADAILLCLYGISLIEGGD